MPDRYRYTRPQNPTYRSIDDSDPDLTALHQNPSPPASSNPVDYPYPYDPNYDCSYHDNYYHYHPSDNDNDADIYNYDDIITDTTISVPGRARTHADIGTRTGTGTAADADPDADASPDIDTSPGGVDLSDVGLRVKTTSFDSGAGNTIYDPESGAYDQVFDYRIGEGGGAGGGGGGYRHHRERMTEDGVFQVRDVWKRGDGRRRVHREYEDPESGVRVVKDFER
ncbi:hypothetical protein BJX61DRAFT_501469 [Aspergillus egyptiacus]|nr:hypothetical protein BJX61DRAFT_501469 [Aspergillus egyptiacus]